MIVEFYEFQRFVYFKFCQIIHNRFVVILFENSADMRNAVIQVGGDSAGYCKSLKMIGAKAEPQIKFRSTYTAATFISLNYIIKRVCKKVRRHGKSENTRLKPLSSTGKL